MWWNCRQVSGPSTLSCPPFVAPVAVFASAAFLTCSDVLSTGLRERITRITSSEQDGPAEGRSGHLCRHAPFCASSSLVTEEVAGSEAVFTWFSARKMTSLPSISSTMLSGGG